MLRAHASASRLAEQLLLLPDDEARLDVVYRRCLGRRPTQHERDVARRFLEGATKEEHRQRWAGWVRVLLASNEFVYVD